MAETVGSLIDKICIAELKRFHMGEQVERTDTSPDHRQACEARLETITRQRDDLIEELNGLYRIWRGGRWTPKIYRQFKMYNDPKYKIPSETARVR